MSKPQQKWVNPQLASLRLQFALDHGHELDAPTPPSASSDGGLGREGALDREQAAMEKEKEKARDHLAEWARRQYGAYFAAMVLCCLPDGRRKWSTPLQNQRLQQPLYLVAAEVDDRSEQARIYGPPRALPSCTVPIASSPRPRHPLPKAKSLSSTCG